MRELTGAVGSRDRLWGSVDAAVGSAVPLTQGSRSHEGTWGELGLESSIISCCVAVLDGLLHFEHAVLCG